MKSTKVFSVRLPSDVATTLQRHIYQVKDFLISLSHLLEDMEKWREKEAKEIIDKIMDTHLHGEFKDEELPIYEFPNNKVGTKSFDALAWICTLAEREEDLTGHWRTDVYITPELFVVLYKQWYPRPPYCADHREIKILPFREFKEKLPQLLQRYKIWNI